MEDKKQIPKIDWKKLVGKCKDLCHRKDRLLIILLTGILLLVIAVPFSGEGDAETGLMHSGKTKDPSDNTSNEMPEMVTRKHMQIIWNRNWRRFCRKYMG